MIGGDRTRDEGRGGQEERISRGGWRKGGEVMNRKERLGFTFYWNRYNGTQFCLFREN